MFDAGHLWVKGGRDAADRLTSAPEDGVNLNCSIGFDANQATITLIGDVAVESTAVVRDLIQTALARPDVATVMVDLGGVTFLDSSALGVLAAAMKSARQQGITFGVCNPGPMTVMVLQITGLYNELVLDGDHGSDQALSSA